jgi:hypothetical protein
MSDGEQLWWQVTWYGGEACGGDRRDAWWWQSRHALRRASECGGSVGEQERREREMWCACGHRLGAKVMIGLGIV